MHGTPPPFWALQTGPVDRWQIIHFQAPGTVISAAWRPRPTGAPEGDRSQGVSGLCSTL
jgi:vanillate O-demethylase monooxygenase subunit